MITETRPGTEGRSPAGNGIPINAARRCDRCDRDPREPPPYTVAVQPAPFQRTDALAALRTGTFDLVVVGGGITGAGVALDAAARGLRTAVVERDDFASGTSSKSSKMVHGGI